MSRWILFSLIVSVLCFLGFLSFKFLENSDDIMASSQRDATVTERPLQMGAIDLTEYRDEKPVFSIKAERFEIRPRKFGLFRFKSLNEIYLNKLQLQFLSENVNEGKDNHTKQNTEHSLPRPSLEQMLVKTLGTFVDMRKIGHVQRAIIDDFKFLSFTEDPKTLEKVFSARRAFFDLHKRALILEQAQIELPSLKRHISASRLIWDDRKKHWRVGGKALLWDHGKQSVIDELELNKFLEPVNDGKLSARKNELN